MIDRGRALLARFLPQGAILLAVLTFGAYLAGLVRDRIFARTYGAGPELDAYNAAFVLPELLLDVLVAAGLTAPFVPVFTTLRRDAPGDAAPFAQTVLTLAVGVMTVGCVLLFFLAPATVAIIAPGFDAQTQALYLDLFRLMLVTPILFAASITLGEILVAERRFLFYALAPILYNVGIVAGTVLLHDADRDLRGGGRRDPRRVAPPRHPGRRHDPLAGPDPAPACGSGCRPSTSSAG